MSDAARALLESVSALPPGTRLAEFEVRSLLGVGGFGIVYLAFDQALEREVAIKEYMPASMAGRTETLHVSIRSQSDAEVFALGLRSFVNEAKLLARFDHASLIKVHRFWEANGTAYMAMPVLRGRTMRDIRKSTGRAPDEAWLRETLTPLLGALEVLHREGVYHRDIAPDNIHIEGDGRPVLLDFGAARRVISGKTQTLTAILKPAYAPIEQYAESASVKQGPWTDLYALGATLHYMLLGHPPAPATARTVSDEGASLAEQSLPGCTPGFLAIIDWMLAPRPAERPQSVTELRAALEGRARPPQRAPAPPRPAQQAWDKTVLSSAPSVTMPLSEVTHGEIDLDTSAQNGPSRLRPADGNTTRSLPQRLARTEALPHAADDAHRLKPPPARSKLMPLTLLGLVIAGMAGYMAWAKFGPAASGGVMAAASTPASAVAATATVASPSVPASAAVPVATMATTAATAAAGSVATGTTGAVAGASPSTAEPAGATSDAAAVGVVASPTATPSNPIEASAAAQVATSPGGTSAGPLPSAGPTPTAGGRAGGTGKPAAAARAAEPGPSATPEARCSGRSPLSRFVCMERECLRPRFKEHSECVTWRMQARQREGGGN